MLRLPEFEYLAPRELAEATGLLAAHGPQAMVVAGGTDLFPNMKRRQQEPPVVIGLRGVRELKTSEPRADGGLRVGAMLTLHELSERLGEIYPALATAAGLVSTPHLRR